MRITFGTDGWRAIIGKDFTTANVRIVAQAIADHLKLKRKQNVVALGYDTRKGSPDFARAIAEVLAGNGIRVLSAVHPTPTPAVSLMIKAKALSGGVIVTASHNSPDFNGIKFKAPYAGPASPAITKKIESLIGKNKVKRVDFDEGTLNSAILLTDFNTRYVNAVRGYLDLKQFKKKKFRIAFDTMHGVGDGLILEVLRDTLVSVDILHREYDFSFGGIPPEPIEKNLSSLMRKMKQGSFDIGLAIDGDADRIGAVRPDGAFVSSGEIISLLLIHLYEDKKWRGAVAKTISGTSLINKIAAHYKLKLYETPVGFKHICKLMLEDNILIGGEESGGIGFKNYMPERDGMLSGLLLLEMMACRKQGIIDIMNSVEKRFGIFRYLRADAHIKEDAKKKLLQRLKKNPFNDLLGKRIVETKIYDGTKFIASDGSWLLLRFSGTEPIIRIYAESNDLARTRKLIGFGKELSFG